MATPSELEALRTSATQPVEDDALHLDWTLALAGGEGVRLSDYVQRRFGRRIPKQYCCLLGNRSMLQHTLDRLNRLTPASRTITVIGTHHGEIAKPQLAGRSDHVFRQPAARDTGMALYIALAMIKRWNPNAIVTITPTDHYVAPASKYVEQVRAARGVAARMRDTVVILGAHPSEPDPELGYLSLGDQLVEVPQVRSLVGFVEKPSVARATELRAAGALWNTMVTCGTVDALWELGRTTEPRLIDILDSLVPLIGTPDEEDAIEYIYGAYLPVSFSRDMLERAPQRLAAMELEGVEWSDWGRPERIETVLAMRRSRALVPDRALAP
ncbi:MAG: putative Mannose-phosphate guanylyltransferase [Myxococcales bacterium]|nr:putative Mannose-phosphate guanylyltransferase [Myxococcales bacterium]